MNKPVFTKSIEFKLPMGILAGAVAPDGKQIVAGCMDGVYQADLESKQFQKLYQPRFLRQLRPLFGSGINSVCRIRWPRSMV